MRLLPQCVTLELQSSSNYRGRAASDSTPCHGCRGAGAFGDILYGSCQYASIRDGVARDYSDLPFDKAQVAALAQKDPDYPGSCGRCYEIRSGAVHPESS